MTRQDFIKKWLFYGLALAMTAGLQGLVFSRFRLMGTVPVLLPLALAALATLEGAASGAGFGVAVGVFSMYTDGSGPWIILAASLGGLVVGLVARYVLRQDFIGYIICAVGLYALRLAWCVVPRWLAEVAPLEVLLRVGVPEALWSLLFSPVIYLLFRFFYRRWGSAYYAR